MTAPTELAPLPATHPVRRFSTVVVVAGLLATALWWFGALTPRLDAWSSSYQLDTVTNVVTVSFDIRNQGGAGVRVLGVEDVRAPGYTFVSSTGVDVWLARRDSTTVEATYRVDCAEAGQGNPSVALRAKTWLGITRTVRAHFVGPCAP